MLAWIEISNRNRDENLNLNKVNNQNWRKKTTNKVSNYVNTRLNIVYLNVFPLFHQCNQIVCFLLTKPNQRLTFSEGQHNRWDKQTEVIRSIEIWTFTQSIPLEFSRQCYMQSTEFHFSAAFFHRNIYIEHLGFFKFYLNSLTFGKNFTEIKKPYH